MKNNKLKVLLLRIFFVSLTVGISILLVYFIFRDVAPELVPALRAGDTATIEKYLDSNNNIKGMILTAILQMVQVISVFIPSMPIQVAAGVVFGVMKGFVICHLSNVAGNCIVYIVYSKMSSRLNELIPMKDDNKVVKFIRSSSSPMFMVAMTCLIPAVPNGFVPYAAVTVKVPLKKFAFAVWSGSFFPVFMMCFIGKRILAGDFVMAVALIIVSFAAAVFLTVKQKKIIAFLNNVRLVISKKLEK